MKSSRSTLRSLALLLALTGMLFRGLIPVGFMPSMLPATNHGAVLVFCNHGQLDVQSQGEGGSDHSSTEQCPFGAAIGPALLGAIGLFAFERPRVDTRPVLRIALRFPGFSHLQPPPRGPPVLS
jgi:hypothetical protein